MPIFSVPERSSEVWKTPMFEQYWRIKDTVPGSLLFYRMGDFYELFGEDAVLAAPLLEVQLTARDKGALCPVPMCGVPVHAWESYAEKLLAQGHRVALCEQLTEASAKGASKLVERGVLRILTPGLPIQPSKMASKEAHWFLSLSAEKKINKKNASRSFQMIAYDFLGAEIYEGSTEDISEVQELLLRLKPKEILLPSSLLKEEDLIAQIFGQILGQNFGTQGVGQGKISPWPGEDAKENFLEYLRYTQRCRPEELNNFIPEVKNLWSLSGKKHKDSARLPSIVLEQWAVFPELFELLDHAGSALGSRKLRALLSSPLSSASKIQIRQKVLKTFSSFETLLKESQEVYDFERLLGRFRIRAASFKELHRFLLSLEAMEKVFSLGSLEGELWNQLFFSEGLGSPEEFLPSKSQVEKLHDKVRRSIKKDVDVLRIQKVSELIHPGFDPTFDELLDLSLHAEKWLQDFEARLQKETGITTLKLRFNRVFGYYIEVTKSHLLKVPSYFERKQTTVSGERFTCAELRQKETEILSASLKTENYAQEILENLKKEILACDEALKAYMTRFAWMDAFAGLLSSVSTLRRFGAWILPEVQEGPFCFDIQGARHPVLEFLSGGNFIANSLELGTQKNPKRLLLLTGPNMAGKSTLMREMGLCLLLAQCGFFVPAQKMSWAPASGFFSRMGATDKILQGDSTFMVEMKETALILREADKNSFVLIDEIGRGTSTEDGLSIAQAVLEYLHDSCGALTIFATHYHELSEIAEALPSSQNASLAIQEWKGELVFLRRLEMKAAEKSYGIHVAKSAGLPKAVIEKAEKFFANHSSQKQGKAQDQMSLFDNYGL